MTVRKFTSACLASLAALIIVGIGSPATAASSSAVQRSNFPEVYLQLVVDDGAGEISSRDLVCEPAGGTHPHPRTACATLTANGKTALPAVPGDANCTDIDGGDQTAMIIGVWNGALVNAYLSRKGGCEIARWNAMSGLLPALDGYTGITW